MSELQWNGEAVYAELDKAVGVGVAAATVALQGEIRRTISRQGAPTSATGKAGLARAIEYLKGKISPKRVSKALGRDVQRAFELSALGGFVDPPGGSPRLRTGALRRSIDSEVEKDTGDGIVGSALEYARIHEYGGTINHPGGTPYRFIAGRIVFLRKIIGAGKNTSVTNPHKITIPARPYFRPSVERSGGIMLKAFVDASKASLGGDA